jgi:hypothetical protein
MPFHSAVFPMRPSTAPAPSRAVPGGEGGRAITLSSVLEYSDEDDVESVREVRRGGAPVHLAQKRVAACCPIHPPGRFEFLHGPPSPPPPPRTPIHYPITPCSLQLVLRNGQFTSFDAACCPRLGNLEILSVSNNRLVSVEGFHHFRHLVEVGGVCVRA